jgi:hypothetical protein
MESGCKTRKLSNNFVDFRRKSELCSFGVWNLNQIPILNLRQLLLKLVDDLHK